MEQSLEQPDSEDDCKEEHIDGYNDEDGAQKVFQGKGVILAKLELIINLIICLIVCLPYQLNLKPPPVRLLRLFLQVSAIEHIPKVKVADKIVWDKIELHDTQQTLRENGIVRRYLNVHG